MGTYAWTHDSMNIFILATVICLFIEGCGYFLYTYRGERPVITSRVKLFACGLLNFALCIWGISVYDPSRIMPRPYVLGPEPISEVVTKRPYMLTFDNVPLGSIAAEINRRVPIQGHIEVKGPAKDLRFTATLDYRDTHAFPTYLASVSYLRVVHTDYGYLVTLRPKL